VIVDEIILGSAFIHKTTTSSSSDKTKIKGVFENKVLTGNKMEPIDNIIFSIPNLMGISGGVVKKISPTRITTTLSRILLDNEKWKIIIDKSIDKSSFHYRNTSSLNIMWKNLALFGNLMRVKIF
jgi:hypothetical protein